MNDIQVFDEKKFGQKLKKLRLTKGLKIRELENLSGVSNAYLSQLENGKRGKPSPEIIKKLAPHLDTSYTDLMKMAGYINEEIDDEAIDLMNNTDNIEKIFDYTFDQFISGISEDGEVLEKYCKYLLSEIPELENEDDFFNKEDLKDQNTWKVIYDNLNFQEKIDFLMILKKDDAFKEKKKENQLYFIETKSNYYKKDDIVPTEKSVLIPILGYIAAGQPIFADEHIIDYEVVPGDYDKEHFMLVVKGDSMQGSRIYPGDKVLVKLQPEVENGEIAVVNVNGDDATLKKVKKYEDGSVWLVSTNEKYAPIPFQKSSRIIGKVVKVIFEP
ncbi:helix-turn-helix domain-containing protein [Rossellomorea aquimaris]|uniref:helix-turn-helix domain-containing protein n=1 Tax=Rossellomorea aquimaris TaxID=189382 RepID=UPI001CD6B78A|nr:S24 family peptidase [Rossellomorea aquimaris]MCA1058084.1 helix-turn-helix domain-containing protein [Rossellomorea aquimaris]